MNVIDPTNIMKSPFITINNNINFLRLILSKSLFRSIFFLIPKKEFIILLNHIKYERYYNYYKLC